MEDLSRYNPAGSLLRRAQLRMLEILKIVDTICRQNNIPYWIEAGTLLGAVRHGGFIPWDDDLDISILRTDYARLRALLQEQLPKQYVLQDKKTDSGLPMIIAKVRDTKSFFQEDYSDKLKYTGIYIDIFPFEKIPCWKWKRFLDYIYGHSFRGIRNYADTKDTLLSYLVYPIAKCLVAITRFINKFIPTNIIAAEYGWTTTIKYDYNDVFPVKEIEFEGLKVFGPQCPHKILQTQYGDYMQIPPKEKRAIHTKRIEFYD